MLKLMLFILVASLVTSCSTKQCSPADLTAQNKKNHTAQNSLPQNLKPENYMKKIKVYKQDGSIQCEPDTGISLDKMASELANITIHNKEKKHDGLLRAQMCGQPTGQCNVFEINLNDLAQAEKLGFKIWKND